MDNKYQTEIDEFNKNFGKFRDSRIVLYGIGRMTMTLLEGAKEYNFIGLLDKDKDSVGKIIEGVEVITLENAEECADLIVINTSATYWELIYERIKNVKIPIYFRNGERPSCVEMEGISSNSYWEEGLDLVKQKIEDSEVVAFDFFDTLVMRKTYLPEDVFRLTAEMVRQKYGIGDYLYIRKRAIASMQPTYTLEQLYEEIGCQLDLDAESINYIKHFEISLEEKLLSPRAVVLNLLKIAIECKKEVHIVSDMYLPIEFYKSFIEKTGNINYENIKSIRLSCVRRKTKQSGELWRELFQEYGNKRILCIGDNEEADISIPKSLNRNVDTFCVPKATQLLQWSSLKQIAYQINTSESDIIMGLICNKLFNSPFSLNKTKGQVFIQDPKDMGYVVFGPILLEFCKWIQYQVQQDEVDQLIFMSRDGYFLKRIYEIFLDRCEKIDTKYIGISRQLAMIANITSEEALVEFIMTPYSGTANELLEDRFDIYVDEKVSLEEICGSIEANNQLGKQIWDYVNKIRQDYIMYLTAQEISNNGAVIDIGYYGNNQKYLNRLIDENLKGYYMVANLDESNPNANVQEMKACFQSEDDKKALKSDFYNKLLFIESFLTAPYGMVAAVDSEGEFVCKKPGKNQKNFAIKEQMFEGVKAFVNEYKELFGRFDIGVDSEFCVKWYDYCFSNRVSYADIIRRSFNNDNSFMNRFDNSLFE